MPMAVHSSIPMDENAAEACRTISHFATETTAALSPFDARKEALLRDLCRRLPNVPSYAKTILLLQTWHEMLPVSLRSEFPLRDILDQQELRGIAKGDVDVGIVTMLGVEAKAVLRSLGLDENQAPDMVIREFPYWLTQIERKKGRPLTVVVTMVGQPRNVQCAIATEQLLGNFDVKLVMLMGIAAGVRSKVRLGDVVCAERVFDYEHVRLEVNRLFGLLCILRIARPRPLYIEATRRVKIALQMFDDQWFRARFSEMQAERRQETLPQEQTQIMPQLHRGTTAAGEKLWADGSLARMQKAVDQRIRGGDQEDSGFAQVCEFRTIPWCIFRGVCDYGDPSKNDSWHKTAALSAAVAGTSFLQHSWEEDNLTEGRDAGRSSRRSLDSAR